MVDPRRRTVVLESPSQIDAITSPLRQEIVTQLGRARTASIKLLAEQLCRSPHSLYPHVRRLLAAGIVCKAETRRTGRRDEAWYALVGHRIRVGASDASAAARAARERTTAAIVRQAGREAAAASTRDDIRRSGARRQLLALRAVRRLTGADLARVNRAIERLLATLPRRRRTRGAQPFALT